MNEGWRDTLIAVGKSMPGYEDKEASKVAWKEGRYKDAIKSQAKALGKAALTGGAVALGGYAALKGLGSGSGSSKEATPQTTLSTEFKNKPVIKTKKTNLSAARNIVADTQEKNLESKYREKSLQQMKENKMSDIRKMVRENVEYKDFYINGRPVTLNTSMAKRILEVYDSVNATNKKLVEGMLNEDMESFKKLLNFSIKA